jgi:hypothetical protein
VSGNARSPQLSLLRVVLVLDRDSDSLEEKTHLRTRARQNMPFTPGLSLWSRGKQAALAGWAAQI